MTNPTACREAFEKWYWSEIRDLSYSQARQGWEACWNTRAVEDAEASPAYLPVLIYGKAYDVPIRVQLHIVALEETISSLSHPMLDEIRECLRHCVSAADEGVDYACSKEELNALTTFGLMEKCGRRNWSPTKAGEEVAGTKTYTHPRATSAEVERALNEMRRYLPVLEALERDPDVWSMATEGTGIATLNGYRHAIDAALAKRGEPTP